MNREGVRVAESNKRYRIGYTQGVFDMFHVGHLNIIDKAAVMCDRLVVGINSDELVKEYKGKTPVVNETDRARIVSGLRSVSQVEIVSTLDKCELWRRFHFDAVFIGDDWKGSDRWIKTEQELAKMGAKVEYLPYTKGISSTGLRDKESVGEIGDMSEIVDKEYCMSSYLAFRYVLDGKKVFKKGMKHKEHILFPEGEKKPCLTAEDIDYNIRKLLEDIDLSKTGVMLSGGMDSAILASYMPKGTKAYTARCIGTNAIDETEQAKRYCDIYDLEHVIVDVTWEDYKEAIDELAAFQGSPIISNEPQAYKIAKNAVNDGLKCIVQGDVADAVFGGYSKMLSKEWSVDDWIERSIYVRPEQVLKRPTDIYGVYEDYKLDSNVADNNGFIYDIYGRATAGAMSLPCRYFGLDCVDPYEQMIMAEPLDLDRIRHGDSKYLIRELFRIKYPMIDIPEKKPMSRPADAWMSGWGGVKREEFIPDCTEELTGEQKLLVYSLERFLDIIDA